MVPMRMVKSNLFSRNQATLSPKIAIEPVMSMYRVPLPKIEASKNLRKFRSKTPAERVNTLNGIGVKAAIKIAFESYF